MKPSKKFLFYTHDVVVASLCWLPVSSHFKHHIEHFMIKHRLCSMDLVSFYGAARPLRRSVNRLDEGQRVMEP